MVGGKDEDGRGMENLLFPFCFSTIYLYYVTSCTKHMPFITFTRGLIKKITKRKKTKVILWPRWEQEYGLENARHDAEESQNQLSGCRGRKNDVSKLTEVSRQGGQEGLTNKNGERKREEQSWGARVSIIILRCWSIIQPWSQQLDMGACDLGGWAGVNGWTWVNAIVNLAMPSERQERRVDSWNGGQEPQILVLALRPWARHLAFLGYCPMSGTHFLF